MSVITKDLGVATAYGYAKSKGYTGTEEEFAELMASYADVAEQAEAAAQDAEDAKDAAVSAKNDAVTAKTAAESAQTAAAGSAQTASTKASEASGSAQTAAGSATAAGNSATAAAGSAQTAQAAAQTATTKASEASSSASAASTAKTGAETARTGAQTAQANAEAAASSVSASAAQIEQNTEDITGLKNDLNENVETLWKVASSTAEVSGAIDKCENATSNVSVNDLSVEIGASGFTGATVTHVGKNLIRPYRYGTYTHNGVSVTINDDGSLHFVGTVNGTTSFAIDWGDGNAYAGFNYEKLAGQTVIYSCKNATPTTLGFMGGYINTSGGAAQMSNYVYDNAEGTLVLPSNFARLRCYISFVQSLIGQTIDITLYPMVRLLGDSKEWVGVKSEVKTVDWSSAAGTITDGNYDFTTGLLDTGSAQKWDVTLNGSTIQGVYVSSGIVDNPYPVKQYPPTT